MHNVYCSLVQQQQAADKAARLTGKQFFLSQEAQVCSVSEMPSVLQLRLLATMLHGSNRSSSHKQHRWVAFLRCPVSVGPGRHASSHKQVEISERHVLCYQGLAAFKHPEYPNDVISEEHECVDQSILLHPSYSMMARAITACLQMS